MRLIVKNGEPNAWRKYRNTPGVDFEPIPELKAALLEEQGHLCCYCMSRIKIGKMKVEHYMPRRHEHLKMDYTNLFAACTGDYCPDKHCDTRKEDAELSIHPTDPRTNCEKIIGYSLNGKLTYPDAHKQDIEETLNLNNPVLVANRRRVLDGVAMSLKKRGYTRAVINKQIDHINNKDDDGKYAQFSSAIIWLLNKKLKAN